MRADRADWPAGLLAHVAQPFPCQAHLVMSVVRVMGRMIMTMIITKMATSQYDGEGDLADSEVGLQGFSEAGGGSLVRAHLAE